MAASASVKWGSPVREVVINSAGAPQPGMGRSSFEHPDPTTEIHSFRYIEPTLGATRANIMCGCVPPLSPQTCRAGAGPHPAPSASTRRGRWQQDGPRSSDVQGESCTWALLREAEQEAGSTEAADRGKQCGAGWAPFGKHPPGVGFTCCLR